MELTVVGGGGLAALVALLVVAIYMNQRVVGIGQIPSAVADAVRADLLRAVGDASTERGKPIYLGKFWRSAGWNRAQQYMLLRPLLRDDVLQRPSTSPAGEVGRWLLFKGLCQPPSTVILNSRDWNIRATSSYAHAPSVVIGTISGGHQQFGDHNTMNQYGVAAENLQSLIVALRQDAQAMVGAGRARADEVADEIQDSVHAGRWDQVVRLLKTVTALVSASDGIMSATANALKHL